MTPKDYRVVGLALATTFLAIGCGEPGSENQDQKIEPPNVTTTTPADGAVNVGVEGSETDDFMVVRDTSIPFLVPVPYQKGEMPPKVFLDGKPVMKVRDLVSHGKQVESFQGDNKDNGTMPKGLENVDDDGIVYATSNPFAGQDISNLREESNREGVVRNKSVGGIGSFLLKVVGAAEKVIYTVKVKHESPIPATASWIPGDTHVHSRWSDGYPASIPQRAQMLRLAGLRWAIITDHAQMLFPPGTLKVKAAGFTGELPTGQKGSGASSAAVYEAYCHAVNALNTSTGPEKIVAFPGLEYSCYDDDMADPGDPHVLFLGSYQSGDYIANTGSSSDHHDAQHGLDLIKALIGKSDGLVSIAHPCDPIYPWFDRDDQSDLGTLATALPAKSSMGLEVLNGGGFAENPASGTTRLSGTRVALKSIAGHWNTLLQKGHHVAATAGSDCHLLSALGRIGHFWTYIHLNSGEALTPNSVKTALREGRTIASTGPLLILSCAGKTIGDSLTSADLAGNPKAEVQLMGYFGGVPKAHVIYVGASGILRDDEIVLQLQPSKAWTGTATSAVPSGTIAVRATYEDSKQSAYTSPMYVK
jgi:hypothetical protein